MPLRTEAEATAWPTRLSIWCLPQLAQASSPAFVRFHANRSFLQTTHSSVAIPRCYKAPRPTKTPRASSCSVALCTPPEHDNPPTHSSPQPPANRQDSRSECTPTIPCFAAHRIAPGSPSIYPNPVSMAHEPASYPLPWPGLHGNRCNPNGPLWTRASALFPHGTWPPDILHFCESWLQSIAVTDLQPGHCLCKSKVKSGV